MNDVVRRYRGFVTLSDGYLTIEYFSRYKNHSERNMIDLKDSFYKKYGLEEFKKVIRFDFGFYLGR